MATVISSIGLKGSRILAGLPLKQKYIITKNSVYHNFKKVFDDLYRIP